MKILEKSVGYAYMSSATATKLGFGKTGCYYVALGEKFKPSKAVKGFATRPEADKFAATLSEPFSRFTMRR